VLDPADRNRRLRRETHAQGFPRRPLRTGPTHLTQYWLFVSLIENRRVEDVCKLDCEGIVSKRRGSRCTRPLEQVAQGDEPGRTGGGRAEEDCGSFSANMAVGERVIKSGRATLISSADLYGSPDSTRPTFAILDDDTVVVKRGGNKNDFGEWYDENACNKHWPFTLLGGATMWPRGHGTT